MPATATTEVFGPVNEATSSQLTALLVDDAGLPVAGSVLSSLTLTVYVPDVDLTIVGSRDAQDVLNVNGVTLDELGVLVWSITPADTTILDETLDVEEHRVLFTYTWGINKQARHECVILVRNLQKVS